MANDLFLYRIAVHVFGTIGSLSYEKWSSKPLEPVIRTIAGDDRYETEVKHISGYIRKLPDGQKASERAVTLAQSLGYDLADNETYVQPFERSSWIIRK